MIKPYDSKLNTDYLVEILETEQAHLFPDEINQHREISLAIFDRETQVGGVTGGIFGNRLHISLLGVQQPYRHHCYGKQLMAAMEQLAREDGCKYLTVNTQDFQARQFYEKLDFSIFGKLVDCPFEGTTKYFLQKELSY